MTNAKTVIIAKRFNLCCIRISFEHFADGHYARTSMVSIFVVLEFLSNYWGAKGRKLWL